MSLSEELERLAQLKASGALSDKEFTAAKNQILTAGVSPQVAPITKLRNSESTDQFKLSENSKAGLPQNYQRVIDISKLNPAINDPFRLISFLFDCTIVFTLFYILCEILSIKSSDEKESNLVWIGVLVLLIFRDSIMPGGSIGKRLFGIILLDTRTGQPLAAIPAFLRQFYFYLTLIIAGFIAYGMSLILGTDSEKAIQYGIFGSLLSLIGQIKLGNTTLFDKATHSLITRKRDYKKLCV
jgi:RDD family/Short C-terminal domain